MNHWTNTRWNGHKEWHKLEWVGKFADFIHVSLFLLQKASFPSLFVQKQILTSISNGMNGRWEVPNNFNINRFQFDNFYIKHMIFIGVFNGNYEKSNKNQNADWNIHYLTNMNRKFMHVNINEIKLLKFNPFPIEIGASMFVQESFVRTATLTASWKMLRPAILLSHS